MFRGRVIPLRGRPLAKIARNRRAQRPVLSKAPAPQGKLEFVPVADLAPDSRNPRNHDRAQVRAIAKSIEAFGFNAPILIDRNRKIITGHGRHEAAKHLGLAQVPVRRPPTPAQLARARIYMSAIIRIPAETISLGRMHAGQIAAFKALRGHRLKALRCGRRYGKTDFGKIWIADGLVREMECAWFAPQHNTW